MEENRGGHRAVGESEFAEALKAVATLSRSLSQPSVIIGGTAVIAHGYARVTTDVDLAVIAGPDAIGELLVHARAAGFHPRIDDAETFAAQNLVLLLEHTATGIDLDLSLAQLAFEERAAKHAVHATLGGAKLRVAPLSALLIYKMIAARPKDLDDVRALLATQAKFDHDEVISTLEEIDELLDTQRAREFASLASVL